MLLRGDGVGGECARVHSEVEDEVEVERFLFLKPPFTGLAFVWLDTQVKASP